MRSRIEQPPMKLILDILEEWGEMDVHCISNFLGIHKRNVREYLKLLKEEKKIYIMGYSKAQRGPALPLFYIGNKKDAPYPKSFSPATRMANSRRRKESCLWM